MILRGILISILLLGLPWPLQAQEQEKVDYQDQVLMHLVQAESLEREAWMDELSQEFEDEYDPMVWDPLQDVNRLVFAFNDKLYVHFLQPVSRAYDFLVPDFMQQGISNFFYNLSYPQRLANNLLQGQLLRAGQESGAFVVNTAFGLGGLLEPAQEVPILEPQPPPQDLGLTLGKYGVGQGPYLVWPVIGPSTVRDSVGTGVDGFIHPMTFVESYPVFVSAKAVEGANLIPKMVDNYFEVKKGALDSYLAVRSAYVQYRNAQMRK